MRPDSMDRTASAAQTAPRMAIPGPGEMVVDLFAGGGGASEALRQALGRDPDIAINHDAIALGLHAANHPSTRHLREDIWQADPLAEVGVRRVGWLHASPDCTHFSQAKGGQPRSKATRSLSWVVLKWAGRLARAGRAPRIISLENVAQILQWGPLVAKRDKATGRVIKIGVDGKPSGVAALGERVPVWEQFLVPDRRHAGRTWRQFVRALQSLGYAVEWRKLRACDYGAGTTRLRLYMVARCDGLPIRWPVPTHGEAHGLHPYVTAADCIDWSVPCPSIFDRKKPLAEATCRRIAKGMRRYVLDAVEPFIVQCANASANGVATTSDPLGVITAWPRGGSHALVSPTLVQAAHGDGQPGRAQRWGSGAHAVDDALGTITASNGHAIAAAHLVKFRFDSDGGPIDAPLPTITSGAGAARPAGAAHAMGVLTAFLEQANGGFYDGAGHDPRSPLPTICGTGSQQRLVTAHMAKLRGTSHAAPVDAPLHTISAGGEHHAVVECTLSPDDEASALRVAAFLIRYHSEGGQLSELDKPLSTVTTRDRLALVTVTLRGVPYVIVDLGLRMLPPADLFRAQGFPPEYVIDRTADGRVLSKSASVRLVGNSVSPPPMAAIVRANSRDVDQIEIMAA